MSGACSRLLHLLFSLYVPRLCPGVCVLRLCPLVCVLRLCLVYVYNFTGWCAKESNFGFIDPDVLGKLNQVCFQPTLIFLLFSLIFCFINDIPLNCECSQHSSPPCSSSLESYGWCSCNGPNQSRFESSYKASDISGQPWKEIMVSPVFWTLMFFSPGKWNRWRWGRTLTLPRGNDLKWVAICETWQIKKEEVMWTCLYFMVYIRIPNIWVSSYED